MPHLKRGAIRDFLSIMEEHGYYKDDRWNRSDYIYTFETGTKIEFFSADSADKVRGPRRDILFINECNNVSFETYTRLAIRTNEDIYLDYNPVQQFWTVYGEGLLGESEGRMYTGWHLDLQEIPHEARLERYGLDFDYTNDPTALIARPRGRSSG
jgi:phage terminase large subunit